MKAVKFTLSNIRIGSYISYANVCQDGYSTSKSPVPGFDTSEILSKLNQCQPLMSTDGYYHNELLRNVFNIGLKRVETVPLWVTPNSMRQLKYTHYRKEKNIGDLDPTLHRKFAGLINKDMRYKVEFANKYGLLRRHELHNVVFSAPNSGKQLQMGESLLWWQEEIFDLDYCLRLWDMVCSRDKELQSSVLWHKEGITIQIDGTEVPLVKRATMNLLSKWAKSDVEGPALYYLSLELDRRLKNSLTPRISDSQEHEISIYPDSLLSEIWLMFLMEFTARSRLVRCVICGDYFGTNDPRSRFCSTRCRMRKYRNQQNKRKQKRDVRGQSGGHKRPWRDSNPRPAA